MQGVTLTIIAIFTVLVVTLRPSYALAAYITALLWYPPYLVISIGTIDISVGRFVVAALLLRCLCDSGIRSKFLWNRLDTWVAVSMVVYVVTYCITISLPSAMENRGGFLMDTWFAYMAARFIITDRSKLISVIKCIGIVLVPLAILGVVESVTGWQPFATLRRFSPLVPMSGRFVSAGRFGFARAIGPFSHAILFGGSFAMFLPLVYYLRCEKGYWHTWAYIISVITFFGSLSSMSSGPWVMAIVVVFCLILEKYKRWVIRMLIFFVFSCVLINMVSYRPFYHVLASYANPLGGDSWHRAWLIDQAIQHFDEWWLLGYGDKDPGWWSDGFDDEPEPTDVTNEYILAGVKHGILGVVALCVVLITAFRHIVLTYKKTTDVRLKSLCWAFGTLLFSVMVTWMSVSFFGQIATLFYCTLGIIGSLSISKFNR